MQDKDKQQKGLPKATVLRILMAHYGCPCKFREKGTNEWFRGFVNEQTITNYDTHDQVLLLKPLYTITASYVERLHQLMKEEGDDVGDLDLSEQGVKEFRDHLQDNLKLASFIVVDYLRREGFHFPMFGIDLFKAKIAHVFTPLPMRTGK